MDTIQNYEILIRFNGESVAAHIKKIIGDKITPAEDLPILQLKEIIAALSE